ncbi:Fpg/Nei family DNA glycosylase [Dermabacteraceae bacterium P13095]
MPEGHTVHRLARVISEEFAGQRVRAQSPQGRFASGAGLIDNHVLTGTEAIGKHLLVHFAPEKDHPPLHTLHVHLGLYGAWSFAADVDSRLAHAIGAPRKRMGERESDGEALHDWRATPATDTTRLRLVGERALADLVGPAACELYQGEDRAALASRLGPDPLRPDDTPKRFFAAAAKRSSTIGALLMNQAAIAGVGNIYRAEALFRAGLDPFVPAKEVPESVLQQIWDDLVHTMRYGERIGRIVTTEPEHRADPDEFPVPRGESFYVYQRDAKPCRLCGTHIKKAQLDNRTVFWCPTCQKPRKRKKAWVSESEWWNV